MRGWRARVGRGLRRVEHPPKTAQSPPPPPPPRRWMHADLWDLLEPLHPKFQCCMNFPLQLYRSWYLEMGIGFLHPPSPIFCKQKDEFCLCGLRGICRCKYCTQIIKRDPIRSTSFVGCGSCRVWLCKVDCFIFILNCLYSCHVTCMHVHFILYACIMFTVIHYLYMHVCSL